jgi:hypothetical protein
MKKYIIFFISTFIYSQTENFDNLNLISESVNFTIQTPIGTNGFAQNGSLRWYHNTESVVVDNFFLQMSDITPYNGNGFAYLNAGMEGYDYFENIEMIISNVDLSLFAFPYLSFYNIHPDGLETLSIYVDDTLVHTIDSNSSVWVKNSIDLSAFSAVTDATIRFVGNCNLPESREVGIGIDEIKIYSETDMEFVDADTTTKNCNLNPGFDNQLVLKATINTSGSLNPKQLNNLLFTNNSTNYCDNFKNVKLYDDNNFIDENLIAQKDPSSEMDFSLNYSLQSGVNDFWLIVDISQNANENDAVDFDLTQIKIGETSYGISAINNDDVNTSINDKGYFKVTNLNDNGEGSFLAALNSANDYSCDDATIDLTSLSGTLSVSSGLNHSSDVNITILGPGAETLTIDGSNITGDELIYSYGNGSISISGLGFTSFNSDEIIYKPSKGGFLMFENVHFFNNILPSQNMFYMPNSSLQEDVVFSLKNCTFSNNQSNGNELIYIPHDGKGRVEIINCTFFENSTAEGLFYIPASHGTLNIESSTFKNNSASNTDKPSVITAYTDTQIKNSVLENNGSKEVVGSTISFIHSFLSSSNGVSGTLNSQQSYFSGSSGLESELSSNGINTPFVKLTSNSILIGSGSSDAINKDQRGYYRFDLPDIGAYEFDGVNDSNPPSVPDILEGATYEVCEGEQLHSIDLPIGNIYDNYSDLRIENDVCFPVDPSIGSFGVIWTFYDENNNYVQRAQSISVVCETASLNELNNDVIIYPNPSSSIIHIKNSFKTAKIFDLKGQLQLISSGNDLDVSELNRGVYLLELFDHHGKAIGVTKMIKN